MVTDSREVAGNFSSLNAGKAIHWDMSCQRCSRVLEKALGHCALQERHVREDSWATESGSQRNHHSDAGTGRWRCHVWQEQGLKTRVLQKPGAEEAALTQDTMEWSALESGKRSPSSSIDCLSRTLY